MSNDILNITLKKGTARVQTHLNLPSLVAASFMFKGDEGNPFLAPRGVFLPKIYTIWGKITPFS